MPVLTLRTHLLTKHGSIVQYSPRMTVLILDACSVFLSDESGAHGRKNMHGLNLPSGKMKHKRDTFVSYACGKSCEAADTGNNASDSVALMHSCI